MKDLFLFSNFIYFMLIILQIIVNYSFSQRKQVKSWELTEGVHIF